MRVVAAVLLVVFIPGALGQPSTASVEARVNRLIDAVREAPTSERARAQAERAVALARQEGYARGVGRAEYALAWAMYLTGSPEAGALFARAARSARQAGDAETEGYALAWEGVTLAERGEEAAGRARMRAGLAVHRRQGGDEGARHALVPLNLLAFRYNEAGQADSARAVYLTIAAEATRLDDRRSAALADLSLGDLETDRGRYADAARYYRRMGEHVRHGGLDDLATEPPLGLARIDVALGRVEAAAQAFRRVADAAAANGERGYAAAILAELGDLHADSGRPRAALTVYREAQRLAEGDVWAVCGR